MFPGIGAEPIGDDTAGRPGSNHDVVEAFPLAHLTMSLPGAQCSGPCAHIMKEPYIRRNRAVGASRRLARN